MASWSEVLNSEDYDTRWKSLVDKQETDRLWEAGKFEEFRGVLREALQRVEGEEGDMGIALRHQTLLLIGEAFEKEGNALYQNDREASSERYRRALGVYDQCDQMGINPAFMALRRMCIVEKIGTSDDIARSHESVSLALGGKVIFMSRPDKERMKKIITNGGVLDDGSLVDPGQIRNVGEGVEEYSGSVYSPSRQNRKPIGAYIKDFLYGLFRLG